MATSATRGSIRLSLSPEEAPKEDVRGPPRGVRCLSHFGARTGCPETPLGRRLPP